MATAKPKAGPRCPHCSRVCASKFGLRSHLRIHTAHRFNNSLQCNVVVDLDGLQQQLQQHSYCCWPAKFSSIQALQDRRRVNRQITTNAWFTPPTKQDKTVLSCIVSDVNWVANKSKLVSLLNSFVQSCLTRAPAGFKMWTHNRWGAERAWGRWYVILITTLP